MKGARAVLVNVTGGPDLMLFEVDEAVNRIRAEIDGDANILFGSALSEDMEGRVRVSVVATGIDAEGNARPIDNVQKFPARRKPAEPAVVEATDTAMRAVNVAPMPGIVLAEEPPVETPPPPSEEPLTLGGEDAPVMAETARLPVSGIDVQPERKRRVFGLFGGRKRPEASPLVEPSFGIRRDEPRFDIRQELRKESEFALQTAAETRNAQKAPAADLFSAVEDSYEIPAFLKRQKTAS
jgi:cell division protein FtsZ